MNYIKLVYLWMTVWASLSPCAAFAHEVFEFPQGRVQLLGSQKMASLLFSLEPEWHIYWKNPGDSGAAPKWKLTPEIQFEVGWPAPKRIEIQGLYNYGYEDTVVFDFHFNDSSPKSLILDLEFLVCKVECIPYQTRLEIPNLPADIDGTKEVALSEARRRSPLPTGALKAQGRWLKSENQFELEVSVQALESTLGKISDQKFDLFPEDGERFTTSPPNSEHSAAVLRMRIPTSANIDVYPTDTRFLLRADTVKGEANSWLVETQNSEMRGTDTATLGGTHSLASDAKESPLALLLLWAFLGGIILNLMPCVFPVLSLKILSFWGPERNAQRLLKHSWYYAFGVVFSFLILGGLLLILRSVGEEIGWGFQLQSPVFVSILAILFFWLALNLLGFFEFTWTPTLSGRADSNSLVSSFFTGVLATLVATPCTAPFMGAALGAALALPAPLTLFIFLALGLGMAFPFLVLGYFPAGLSFLPRPGNWMLRLKEFLAFPLFLTTIWLLWVLGQQTTIEYLIFILSLLVICALAVWAQGITENSRVKKLILIAGALVSFGMPFSVNRMAQPPKQSLWQEFSEEAVALSRTEGKAVFIDFTAAWCITCQVNKRLVLDTEAMQKEFQNKKVALFRADWTDRNPLIAKSLAKLGRNSLPVYVYYAPRAQTPQLLPELLTREIVVGALNGGNK